MKAILTLMLDVIFIIIIYFGYFGKVEWCYNIAVFYLWLEIVIKNLMVFVPEKQFIGNMAPKMSFMVIWDVVELSCFILMLAGFREYLMASLLFSGMSIAWVKRPDKKQKEVDNE
jgi:hypothetical protein